MARDEGDGHYGHDTEYTTQTRNMSKESRMAEVLKLTSELRLRVHDKPRSFYDTDMRSRVRVAGI